MTIKTIDGETIQQSYREFLAEDRHCKHRRTENAQRQELAQNIAALGKQTDYSSLDLLRILSGILADDSDKRGMDAYFMLWNVLKLLNNPDNIGCVLAFMRGLLQ